MRVDFLLILLLETEDDLHRDGALLGPVDLQIRGNADLRRVLVDVRRDGGVVDFVLHAAESV